MLKTKTKVFCWSELRRLRQFGSRVNQSGANFAVYQADGTIEVLCENEYFSSAPQQLCTLGRQVIEQSTDEQDCQPFVFEDSSGVVVIAAKLNKYKEQPSVALIDCGCAPSREAAGSERLEILGQMLCSFAEGFESETRTSAQTDLVSTELAQAYEQLVLLQKLSMNMKVTEPDESFLQLACDNLRDIVDIEGIAVLLEQKAEQASQLSLVAGSGVIDVDDRMAAIVHTRLTEALCSGEQALLDSEVDSPFKYPWPESLRSIIAVPLYGRNDSTGRPPVTGILVAVNNRDKPDFDTTDIKLFSSVASQCAVFISNGGLFRDIKELFIGALKALASSIDAKDRYTRGHSERVAIIARWIAQRLCDNGIISQEQVHQSYLAGLLHDIGKMGIDESVLRKPGALTEEQVVQIRRHPSVGAAILGSIKQMRQIVDGVLHHHERVDGSGYPGGFKSEQISMLGKIVGLADAFDAMTSKRAYRSAMTVEEALKQIEKGLGSQFDRQAGRIFLQSDVHRLWDIIQNCFVDISKDDLNEYGTVAVGALIK